MLSREEVLAAAVYWNREPIVSEIALIVTKGSQECDEDSMDVRGRWRRCRRDRREQPGAWSTQSLQAQRKFGWRSQLGFEELRLVPRGRLHDWKTCWQRSGAENERCAFGLRSRA